MLSFLLIFYLECTWMLHLHVKNHSLGGRDRETGMRRTRVKSLKSPDMFHVFVGERSRAAWCSCGSVTDPAGLTGVTDLQRNQTSSCSDPSCSQLNTCLLTCQPAFSCSPLQLPSEKHGVCVGVWFDSWKQTRYQQNGPDGDFSGTISTRSSICSFSFCHWSISTELKKSLFSVRAERFSH